MLLNDFHNIDVNVARLMLANQGPLIEVKIGVPQVVAQALQGGGRSVPSPHTGLALIDTGATVTSFDETLISSLGVRPTGVVGNVVGATGSGQQNTYPVRLQVISHRYDRDLPRVLGADFSQFRAVDGRQIIGLLGRDFLMNCVLIYNGAGGIYTLAN